MRKALLSIALSTIFALSIGAANPNATTPTGSPQLATTTESKAALQTHFDLTKDEINHLMSSATAGKIFTLQTWLRIMDYYPDSLKIDGQTGPTTRKEIGKYQASLGLKADGIPNVNWEAPLETSVRKEVQQQLSLLGMYEGDIDGVNGRITEDAIKTYEKSINIPEVGTLAPFTLFHLFNPNFLPKSPVSKPKVTPEAEVATEQITAEQKKEDLPTSTTVQASTPTSENDTPNSGLTESSSTSQTSTEKAPLVDTEIAPSIEVKADNDALIVLPKAPEIVALIIKENETEALKAAENARLEAEKARLEAEKRAKIAEIKSILNLEKPIKTFSLSRAEVDSLVIKARNLNIFFTQTALALLDLYDGPLDGANGPATREAISAFEKSIGLPETGKILPKWENPLRQIMYHMVQYRLKEDGFYKGEVDGLSGASTRAAIRAYELASNTEPAGQLSPALLLTLFNTGLNNVTADPENLSQEEIPTDSIEDVTEDGTKPVSEEEDSELKADSNKQEEQFRASVNAFDLSHAKSSEDTALTQLQLAFLGFYTGKVDGVPGPGTTRAVTAFQKHFSLPPSGKLDNRTLAALEVENINKFQRYLQRTGYMKDKPTGTWGPKTRRAVGILKNRYGYQVSDKLDIPAYLILIDEEQNTKFAKDYYDKVIKEREAAAAVKDTQAYLIGFGILNGKADGIMGPATNDAISTYRSQQGLKKGNQIDTTLLESFKKTAPKQAQAYLQQLGYPIKPDGIFGNNSKKQLNAFLTKARKPKSDIVTAAILMDLKLAVNAKQASTRNQANQQRAAANTGNTVKTGSAPRLQKGLQQDGVLGRAPSNTVNGALQVVRNGAGNVVGCKVNNIQMSADWCTGKRNGQSCRVLYKNGRVLSMNCR